MTRLLITDMDGTLVDSMDFLRELAVALVAADEMPADRMRVLYDQTFGKPIVEQYEEWNRLYGDVLHHRLNVKKLVRLYEAVHFLVAPNFPTTDFCRTLARFDHRAYSEWKFALVTSTKREIVDEMGQIRNIRWEYVGGYRGPGTEKRHQIDAAMRQCEVDERRVYYVGDAPSDKALAQDLGLAYFYPSGAIMHQLLGRPFFTGT